jgi:predicted MFS family arabinose efflux permease
MEKEVAAVAVILHLLPSPRMLRSTAMTDKKARALRFVLLVGVMSLFADFTYEGARGIAGPFLAALGASGAVVGIASGLGEFLGYALRIVSGKVADRTRKFWPITIAGYIVQMCAIPALALAGSWPVAAGLLILERVGKATRKPPGNLMLSHAGKEMGGYGWAFGLHEGLDQLGAMLGPLTMAAILAARHEFRLAFAALSIPAAMTLLLLAVTRLSYPRPEELEPRTEEHPASEKEKLPRQFWIYLVGAGLVAAGFADYPLIAFHFEKSSIVSGSTTAVLYSMAMGVSGAGSLFFGKLFDRRGIWVLVPLTLVTAAYAPLAFLGGRGASIAGVALWGLGMGVHESIINAAVATMVPARHRASAYGIFTASYGTAWMLGSALLGWLYDVSLAWLVAAAVVLELAALPFIVLTARAGQRSG